MTPRGYDRFMVDVELGSNLKIGRFTDAEFRCIVTGVWALAAKTQPRGCLAVGGHPATSRDVARQARCSPAVAKRTIEKMIGLGMLEYDDERDWYSIHDWEKVNPSPRFEAEEKQRVKNARRQALFRDRGLRTRIRERDGDRCRYCAVEVDWSDRRGPHGGTYDHVDPDGPNTMENVVVACRGCNSSKSDRKGFKPRELVNLVPDQTTNLDRTNSKLEVEELKTSSLRSDVVECFEYWQDRTGHSQAKLTPERERAVKARLKQDYTVAQICQGIDGAALNPPRSDDGVVYDDLVSICRNGAQLERYMARATAPRPVVALDEKRERSERRLAALQRLANPGVAE